MKTIYCSHGQDYHESSIYVSAFSESDYIAVVVNGGCYRPGYIFLDIESIEKLISDLQKSVAFVRLNQND